jgi:hypothetical protein
MISCGKKYLLALLALFFFSSYSNAQDVQTTPNLIQPNGWQGCLTQHPGWIWGGNVGGPCPVQRAGDGAILFSYGQGTLSQTIAVNQALSGTGIQVRGYEYSWTIKNANAGSGQQPSFDPLNINVSLFDPTNTSVLESKNYDYSYRINDWTTFRGTEEYKNRYSLASVGNLGVSITSKDAGYWAGYYGPEINYISLKLRYSVDVCAANPLSSPECPGYAEAYKQQQCSANTLFDPSCPGYEQAFFTMQCSSNPLYNPSCPGYQQAYFNQQCSLNALFNPQCPGYQQAYFNQQCSLNTLYNKDCPGYEQAFFDYQCNQNQLYNNKCPLYEAAYLSQQCTINSLFSTQCPKYQEAYFNQQCGLNTLWNNQCPGYQSAYQAQLQANACKANPQSNPQCSGYTTVVVQPVQTTIQTVATSQTQDPVAAITETPLVSDPVVNQTITPPKEQVRETQQSTSPSSSPSLGSGLRVPGFTPQISSRQQSTRERAVEAARQTTTRAETATRDAQQIQQDTTITTMAEVPGFSNYQTAVIPDAPFYQPKDLYRGNVIRDNVRAQRSLTQRSDRLHTEMINEQYRK